MANDDLQILIGLSGHLSSLLGYEAVGGTMETIASYFILLIVFIGKAVQICLLRHGLMESSIKNSCHGSIGHQLLAGTDTNQICRVVKRSQVIALLDGLHGLIGQKGRGRELLAAMYDTVSNGTNLIQALNNAGLFIS